MTRGIKYHQGEIIGRPCLRRGLRRSPRQILLKSVVVSSARSRLPVLVTTNAGRWHSEKHVTALLRTGTGTERVVRLAISMSPPGSLLRVSKTCQYQVIGEARSAANHGPKKGPWARGWIAGYHQQERDQQCQPIASHGQSIAMVWYSTTLQNCRTHH